jgi:hypothetical protein
VNKGTRYLGGLLVFNGSGRAGFRTALSFTFSVCVSHLNINILKNFLRFLDLFSLLLLRDNILSLWRGTTFALRLRPFGLSGGSSLWFLLDGSGVLLGLGLGL